ncbi:MAG: HD domain-containing protein [Acidobacteria bacterium]|nr:HD domain-containing protein [Acidobacteriota bacterium]
MIKLEMRKMLHTIAALTDLGNEINSSKDFDEVIRTSLHTCLGTLAIPKGAIARYSAKPRQLKIVAAKGLAGVVGQKIELGVDEVAKIAARTRPIKLTAERNGLAHFVRRNQEMFNKLRAHLAVPMIVQGELIGVIYLSEKLSGEAFSDDDLTIINTIARHIGLAFYNQRLIVSLKRRAEENRRLYKEMRQVYHDVVRAFGSAIDLKDAYTKGHSDRVARYSEAIAREMGLSGEELENIGVAGYLHDIGKITVDRAIINNPRPLTEREFKELNKHAVTGYEILANIRHPWQEIAYMTKCHHEKVDGTGYPQGLRGDEIPLGSRIVTLADSFDAMMTDRPYRVRLPLEKALNDVERNTNSQFDARVVTAFCRLLLKELNGASRERIIIPMIGLKFDRAQIVSQLEAIISQFEEISLAV